MRLILARGKLQKRRLAEANEQKRGNRELLISQSRSRYLHDPTRTTSDGPYQTLYKCCEDSNADECDLMRYLAFSHGSDIFT